MVFGNMGDDSGTGVAFTRDPSTGEKRFYGEFLPTRRARTWWPASARRTLTVARNIDGGATREEA